MAANISSSTMLTSSSKAAAFPLRVRKVAGGRSLMASRSGVASIVAQSNAPQGTRSQAPCTTTEQTAAQLQLQLSRRAACTLAATLPFVPAWMAVADESEPASLVEFKDNIDGFMLGIPEGWSAGEGQVGEGGIASAATRRALAWFPADKAKDVNVTLVITNAAADFTKLGSFGNAEMFGTNLVNQMDRSYLLRASKWGRNDIKEEDVQIAKLVDARDLNGGYLIDYTVQNSIVDKKHLVSLVFLGFNGRYNRLYTLTGQCPEEELAQYEKTFRAICKSFKVPAVVN